MFPVETPMEQVVAKNVPGDISQSRRHYRIIIVNTPELTTPLANL